jgi:ADP-heptose:LPS heptosyltransferase
VVLHLYSLDHLDISCWYFGKTGGLLGTLNHERYDDMIMPNKQITSDAFTLGSAWHIFFIY